MCKSVKEASSSSQASQPAAAASFAGQMTCLSVVTALLAVYCKFTFVDDSTYPPKAPLHSYKIPLALTSLYLLSLPLLKSLKLPNPKSLLLPAMLLYNVFQVLLNLYTVLLILSSLSSGHPFIGSTSSPLCSLPLWIHYTNKYLEFLDTSFMLLRQRYDQVSFLHVYHHFTITWAWYIGVLLWPSGDSYFGALLNSGIHVLMYGYYSMTLMGLSCPWKKYLTLAQLCQFVSVVIYTCGCVYYNWEVLEAKHFTAMAVQVGEMASLFFLFGRFYKKSYKVKKGEKKDDLHIDECQNAIEESVENDMYVDQCAAAVKEGVVGLNEVGGVVYSRVTVGGKEKLHKKAVEKNSWSMVG
ncbi:hypothetical protein TrVE_jg14238 [Triparma verrucosa]|uniref:Elongation of fatty acids protein n=2 Tax=Triparma TaxID=722752 RepID=A0A9W7E935_9STRA|nr:hypothetical protein TrST_g4899 [Triparma strigata]GMH85157.1 hypothetical protein TrVE_jg14238 [Triparma verrucosa]